MLVPSTPTSTSGAFWKGSELGTEPQAQPAAPSTTSEVVKSKSASQPPSVGRAPLPLPGPSWITPAPSGYSGPRLGQLPAQTQPSRLGGKRGGKSTQGPGRRARGGRPP